MKIFLMTLALIAMATGAIAGDRERRGGPQIQGQAQSQLQAQQQGQRQSTTVEGNTFEASSIAPSAYGGKCHIGVSGGIPGASTGISVPLRRCHVLDEASWLVTHVGKSAGIRHVHANNPRMARTLEAEGVVVAGTPKARPAVPVRRVSSTMTAAQRRSEER